MSYSEIIEARVCGIPCKISVDHYRYKPPFRGSPWCCDSADDYYGYEEMEWSVLDRRGRPAEWLERKMTDKDREEVEMLIADAMRQAAEEQRVEAAVDRYKARRYG